MGERERYRRDRTPKALVEVPALVSNVHSFADAMRACAERAAASPTGECELHRHGRKGWVAP